jgi:hypothetical protein
VCVGQPGPIRTQKAAARPQAGGREHGMIGHYGAESPRPNSRLHQHGSGCTTMNGR